MNILHYGLQRSGTNFLETLLRKNYRVHFLNDEKNRSSPLNKHFRLYDDKDIIPEPQYHNSIWVANFKQFESLSEVLPDYYLVISKDPYSWYLSYKNWAQKCNWPAAKHHYIEEYNLFYGKFLELSSQTDKIIFVRYIDLIKDPDAALKRLEATMKLKRKLRSLLALKKPEEVPQSSSFTDERRNYYLGEEYLNEYTDEELQTLNGCLDTQVAYLLGYTRIVAIQ